MSHAVGSKARGALVCEGDGLTRGLDGARREVLLVRSQHLLGRVAEKIVRDKCIAISEAPAATSGSTASVAYRRLRRVEVAVAFG